MNDTLMKRFPLMLVVASTLLFAGVGCARPYYPPPPVAQASPLVQLAKRPRHTRAFHDTPGYDPQLGPFPVYRDAYRDAYLRGYQRGYNRR